MRTLAIIPARSGSKRIPGKNSRIFCGKPLICWTIGFAQAVEIFSRIHVSTDCREIGAIAENCGIDVPFLRSAHLSSDTASTSDVVVDCLDRFSAIGEIFEFVAVLQPTTPWRRRDRWMAAFDLIATTGCDTVFSVAPMTHHPWHSLTVGGDGSVTFFFDKAKRQARSQDTPSAYYLNGSMYLSRSTVVKSTKSMIEGNSRALIFDDPLENIDIDTPDDWTAAEALLGSKLVSET